MSGSRSLVAETVERLLAESIDADAIARAEEGAWLGDVWQAVEETGLTRALLRAENGGADCDWLDVFEIARAVGRHSLPLPLLETILATWLLECAGLEAPAGPIGLVPRIIDGTPGERLVDVPWGRTAEHVVGLVAPASGGATARIACAPRPATGVIPGWNLALEPRDTVVLGSSPQPVGTIAFSATAIRRYGALLRCGQMTGALERILDQSVRYASERVQFGRAIGGFQVIQQELARLAGQVAEATMATEIAFRAAAEADGVAAARLGRDADPTFEIACAKVVVGEAAELAPRIAHQVHGAIGFTYEHSLHFSTRRLWAWRAEFGLAWEWAAEIGTVALRERGGEIWPLLTSR